MEFAPPPETACSAGSPEELEASDQIHVPGPPLCLPCATSPRPPVIGVAQPGRRPCCFPSPSVQFSLCSPSSPSFFSQEPDRAAMTSRRRPNRAPPPLRNRSSPPLCGIARSVRPLAIRALAGTHSRHLQEDPAPLPSSLSGASSARSAASSRVDRARHMGRERPAQLPPSRPAGPAQRPDLPRPANLSTVLAQPSEVSESRYPPLMCTC